MRTIWFFGVLFLLPYLLWAQNVNFEDDFNDQDLTTWSGTTDHFIFISEDENTLLRQNAPAAGISWLSSPSTNTEGYWEFFVRLNFSPSNNNKSEIFLMSDKEDLTDSPSGYMLQAGENLAGDVFRLFKITDGAKDGEILTGITNISSAGGWRVKVSRDENGNWTLEVGTGYAGALAVEDTGTDNSYESATHFGFINYYTSANSANFTHDFKIDIPPIAVQNVSGHSANQLDVIFSREIDFASVQAADFMLNPGNIIPQSANQVNPTTARLNFSAEIPGGPKEIEISGIDDLSGETTVADTTISFFIYDEFEAGDIIINEFLKDPPTGTAEYVELKNTSHKYLNLQNWKIGDNSSLSSFSGERLILPNGYLVVSGDTLAVRNHFGEANYHALSLAALNNGTDQVRLYDDLDVMIDSLEYDASWGGVKVALERRDESIPGIFKENWGESPAPESGTPGNQNIVEKDTQAPQIIDFLIENSSTIILAFSERLETMAVSDISNFSLEQNPYTGSQLPPLPHIQSIFHFAPDSIQVNLNTELEEYDGSWIFKANNLADIFGNSAALEYEFKFYIIATAEYGDVAINEFMYDPASGYSEFIELYNHSDSTYDLQNWTLNDNASSLRSISSSSTILATGAYILLAPDSSISDLFPNAPMIVMGSRFPALNNGTDAIVIRNQKGTLIDSLTYTSAWGGKEISLERRRTDISPVFAENWGDSPSADFGTPGAENQIEADLTAPEIALSELIGEDKIRLIFSERVRQSNAEDISNYTLKTDDFGSVPTLTSATFSSPDTILLEFSAEFQRKADGTYYELTISDQIDIFGNTSEKLTEEFFVIDHGMANYGKVAITEFMYDPTDGYSEFIELYNPSDSAFNLQNWTYNDNSGNRRIITNSNYSLLPGHYMILTPDSTISQNFSNVSFISMGNRFSALNNNNDAIVIRNAHGTLIDSLTYFSSWGGNGISLERRRTDISPTFPENWGDSPSAQFGTPGAKNEIEDDVTAPELLEIVFINEDSIKIIFNERLDSLNATNKANFSISPDPGIQEILYEKEILKLVVQNSLSDGTIYSVEIRNQADVFGNEIEALSVEKEFIHYTFSKYRDVLINEFLYRRKSADDPEFIELYNNSGHNFNLGNWTFSDAASSAKIPENTFLKMNDYLVITDKEAFADEFENAVYLSNFPSLNDNEDAIVIKNENGILIDSLYYFSTWGANQPGISLERKDPLAASNDASNWATSTSENGFSAGFRSSVYEPDETAPEIIFAKLSGTNTVHVVFSEFVNADESDITVNGQTAIISEFKTDNANIITLESEQAKSGEKIEVTFKDIRDVKGNLNPETSVEVAQTLKTGDVVINELLYNPLANSDDNLPDQTEYIELYNRADYAVSLEGMYLHDEPDENNNVRSLFPFTSAFKWIPPKNYVLVYAEDQTPDFKQSRLHQYYELNEQNETFTIRIARSNLSLANSGDAIYLADSSGVVIDSVFYDESWQNPNLYSTTGVSLERIDPDGPGNDESNWSSSTEITGGTPGYQNSIFQQAGAIPDGVGISFSPNPFSPDDDGFDDNLFINYNLDQADYLLRIRIFDRYGRLVRELADGKAAGFEGSLIWDGLTDDKRKNRVGIYIVLFEAYNSANGKRKTFKETVVLARKFR